MATRSKVLAAGASPTVLTAVYTCPALETALVKDIRLSNASTGTAFNTRFSINRSGVVTVDLLRLLIPALSTFDLEPWVVLHPGDTIQVMSDNALIRYWISGAELEGVAD